MSLNVSQGEGDTFIIITSNPKNKWPIWVQILRSLCYSPFHVSQDMNRKLTNMQTTFRIVQIVVAVMNLALGCFGFAFFFIASCLLRGMMTFEGLNTVSIIMAVLQFCVAIAFCIMTLKSLGKRSGDAKTVEHTTSEAVPEEDLQPPSESTSFIQHAPLILSRIKSLIVCKNTKEDILKNVDDQNSLVATDFQCMGIKPIILLIKSLSVCEDIKGTLTYTHTALGVVQIIIGVALLRFGLTSYIWFGAVLIAAGIVCVFTLKFPSPVLLIITVILNMMGVVLSIMAVVQLSVKLVVMQSSQYYEGCYPHFRTMSQEERNNIEACINYKNLNKDLHGGIHTLMTVLAALQFCVAMSFCALTLKVLCKKNGSAKSVEEPHNQKPHMHAEETSIVV